MSDDGMHELHVTAFDVEAGVRHGGLGDNGGPGVPLVALEIEGDQARMPATPTLASRRCT